MATKADVLGLIAQLSSGQTDPVACARYYDEVVYDLGDQMWLSNGTIVPVTNPVTIPNTVIRLSKVFYDSRELDEATLKQMESLNPYWRNVTGDPLAFVVEDEATHTVRFYPAPEDISRVIPYIPGLEWGSGYPSFNMAILHTEYRTELPGYLLWPVALLIMSMDFGRPSDHQDPTMATACGKVAQMLLSMVS